jgi:hypothetical protein
MAFRSLPSVRICPIISIFWSLGVSDLDCAVDSFSGVRLAIGPLAIDCLALRLPPAGWWRAGSSEPIQAARDNRADPANNWIDFASSTGVRELYH